MITICWLLAVGYSSTRYTPLFPIPVPRLPNSDQPTRDQNEERYLECRRACSFFFRECSTESLVVSVQHQTSYQYLYKKMARIYYAFVLPV